ncbi:hypothetical protein GCM10008967_00140 [Bacillus carboniphilus]|uniref:Uncharacterized protein n=1 Tax=Bacillus carboniphilus TaxID=86663 RepID=A0ABN0VP06_9BACI
MIDNTVRVSKLSEEELKQYRNRPKQPMKRPRDWRWPQNRRAENERSTRLAKKNY